MITSYWNDDFNRTDSSTVGLGWSEISGDWSIASNQLVIPAPAGSVMVNTVELPDAPDYELSCNAIFDYTGGSSTYISLITRYVDSSNYYFFQLGGGTTGIILVGRLLGGSPSAISSVINVTLTAGVTYKLTAKSTGGVHKVYLDGVEKASATDYSFGSAGKFGFRSDQTAGSGSVKGDNFVYDGLPTTNKLTKFRRTRVPGSIYK